VANYTRKYSGAGHGAVLGGGQGGNSLSKCAQRLKGGESTCYGCRTRGRLSNNLGTEPGDGLHWTKLVVESRAGLSQLKKKPDIMKPKTIGEGVL